MLQFGARFKQFIRILLLKRSKRFKRSKIRANIGSLSNRLRVQCSEVQSSEIANSPHKFEPLIRKF